MASFDAVDLEVLINLKTNAAGALEASAAIQGVKREAEAAAPSVVQLGSAHKAAAGEMKNFKSAAKDAENAAGDLGGPFGRLSNQVNALSGLSGGLGAATLGVAAGLGLAVVAGKDAIQNADRLEESTNALKEAYKSQGLEVKNNTNQVSNFIDTNKRFIDDQYEARDAIALLIRSTGDQSKAMRAANDAIDVAIAKHIPYSQAVDMLNKALQGQARGLLDIGVSQKEINKLDTEAASAAKEQTKATDEVAKAKEALARANQSLADEEARLGVAHKAGAISTQGVTSASDSLAKAQQRLRDEEERLAGKTHLTVNEQIALRNAHDAVAAAADKLTASKQKLSTEEANLAGKSHLTVSQQIALRDAQQKVKDATDNLTKANLGLHGANNDVFESGNHVTDVLSEVEKHAKGARDAQTSLQASNNELKKDWQDLTANAGPGLVNILDQVVQALDNGVQITEAFISILDKLSKKVPKIPAPVQGAIGNAFAGLGVSGLAEGGVVRTPSFHLVGEAGPEAVIPLRNPARAAQVMSEAGLLSTGGGGEGGGGGMSAGLLSDIRDILASIEAQMLSEGGSGVSVGGAVGRVA